MELLKNFWKEEEGQDLIEYALLLGFITLAVVGALTAIQGNLNTLWGNAESAVGTAAS
jgi:Flp pilus assembly pilin Flp